MRDIVSRIMSLKVWRLITLVLAALSLTMESAHVLELPQKLRYDPQMYAAVNGSLYRYFAYVGGASLWVETPRHAQA